MMQICIHACKQHDVHHHHHHHHHNSNNSNNNNNNHNNNSAWWTLCNNTNFHTLSWRISKSGSCVFTVPGPNLKTSPLGFVGKHVAPIHGYSNGQNWDQSLDFGVCPIKKKKKTHFLDVDTHVESILPWPPRYTKDGCKAIINRFESTVTNTDFIDMTEGPRRPKTAQPVHRKPLGWLVETPKQLAQPNCIPSRLESRCQAGAGMILRFRGDFLNGEPIMATTK